MKKVLALAALVVLTSGCSKAIEPFRDAKVSGHNDKPAEVINMPDGFNNVATKCDGHGHRVFVIYHGDKAYGAVTVVNDEAC